MVTIEFTRHVFATLTYSRDINSQARWATISHHYNRFIQSTRRLHRCNIEYLRVVESHKDGYPHIHVLLQFPDARIRIENTRYFTPTLYAKWKGQWQHGHSDFQKPKHSGTQTLSYILKYLIKNTTSSTIWKHVFASTADVSKSSNPNSQTNPVQNTIATAQLPTHFNKVKLATWSRHFDFTPFTTIQSK